MFGHARILIFSFLSALIHMGKAGVQNNSGDFWLVTHSSMPALCVPMASGELAGQNWGLQDEH